MFSIAVLMWYLQKSLICKYFFALYLIICYAILHCNFLFTNFNFLAIYVISGQTN
jgi:hypothetical protein